MSPEPSHHPGGALVQRRIARPLARRIGAAVLVMLGAASLVLLTGTASHAAERSTLQAGQQLRPGEQLVAGRYRLVMQTDGNAVVYADGTRVRFQTRTDGNPGARLVIQTDGNLVVYAGKRALWHSRTHGNPGARTVIQSDGNLVLYRPDQRPLWHLGVDVMRQPAAGVYAMRPGLAVGTCGSPDNLARSMAGARSLWHGGTGWHGQIVAVGQDSTALVTAWRGSAPHRSVAADPSWNRMSGATARGGDGRLYGVLNFCR